MPRNLVDSSLLPTLSNSQILLLFLQKKSVRRVQVEGEVVRGKNPKNCLAKTCGRSGQSGRFSEFSRSCYGRANQKNCLVKTPGRSGRTGREKLVWERIMNKGGLLGFTKTDLFADFHWHKKLGWGKKS